MKALLSSLLLLASLPAVADEEALPALDEVLFDAELWSKGLEGIMEATTPKPEEGEDAEAEAALRKELEERGIRLANGRGAGFEWLSAQKEGLRARPGSFTLCDEELGEVVMRGDAETVKTIDISMYNRGDDGELSADGFEEKFSSWQSKLDEALETTGKDRSKRGAVTIRGMMWTKEDSAFLLESSWNKSEDRAEFIRLRMISISGARNQPTKITRRSTLDDNVKKNDKGFTYVEGIPMVDQGQKGYCVVATVERVARYYGAELDQHEMAQIADASAGGTSGSDMEEAFKKVTGKIHARTLKLIDFDERQLEKDIKYYNRAAKKAGAWTMDYDTDEYMINPVWFWQKADPKVFREIKGEQNGFDFMKGKIQDYIDQGTPLCWTLFLGMFPEPGLPQSFGGHMRLITGYNYDNPEIPLIYYSDSWGEGHEQKTMRLDEAWCMTMGLYAMIPNK